MQARKMLKGTKMKHIKLTTSYTKKDKLNLLVKKSKEYTLVLLIATYTIFGFAIIKLFLESEQHNIEWPPKVEAQTITPTPTPTLEEYVSQTFGSESYKAFIILHGTMYCGGENGNYRAEATNKNYHKDGTTSLDRGYWQFNDKFHPEVSEECAKDIQCSTNRAYEIFKRDGDFHQWTAGRCIGV